MADLKTEAVVLKTQSFGDYDQILTVFSPDLGVQKMFHKRTKGVKRAGSALSQPLTRCEFIYRKKASELLVILEINVLSYYQCLRRNLDTLESASDMILAINQSQQPGNPSHALFALLVKYLEKVGLVKDPRSLSTSFFLKLLHHDGILGSFNNCSSCHKPIEELWMLGGESFCSSHVPFQAISFSVEEQKCMQILLLSRSLTMIQDCPIPDLLPNKVKKIFQYILTHDVGIHS